MAENVEGLNPRGEGPATQQVKSWDDVGKQIVAGVSANLITAIVLYLAALAGGYIKHTDWSRVRNTIGPIALLWIVVALTPMAKNLMADVLELPAVGQCVGCTHQLGDLPWPESALASRFGESVGPRLRSRSLKSALAQPFIIGKPRGRVGWVRCPRPATRGGPTDLQGRWLR